MNKTVHEQEIAPKEARQGRRTGLVKVLGISIGVAVIGIVIVALLQNMG
ncbi:hypothetical protein [Hyphomonas pacifica]|uniref:Uncharacterized protein n=1 Tax=Hyphomonas pacifica TaxID=1280941 RepID=A0A062U1T4_9PROT|nr:hypothetical protein [Hyphomonas pacifica]KCZ52242.1 hypothetical protein HY2_09500 [Hyphomonas pacifica]RAN35096.1 hypothetical protein HY3_09630 [Hyphomonas pacifica]RAN37557.1 hypothetical protein HY11_08705 [Hyphomonas pacifica]